VDVRVDLSDGVHEVQRADHVVHLGVDRVLPVDHGVRSGSLLAEVHNGVRRAVGHGGVRERGVGQVADAQVDLAPRHLAPGGDPLLERGDGHEAAHAHFDVVLPPHEIVHHGDVMTESREMEGRGPAEIAVAAEHQNLHFHPFLDDHDFSSSSSGQ